MGGMRRGMRGDSGGDEEAKRDMGGNGEMGT